MTSRLAALTARRMALQAECERQRGDVRQIYAGIELRTAGVDRAIETVRRFAPVLAIGAVVAVFALGPSRLLHAVGRGFMIAHYSNRARRWLSV